MNKVGIVLILAISIGALADVRADMSKEEILTGADERIIQIRTTDAVLRLVGLDGKAVQEGLPVRIEQRQHKFLFGCNIFMLNRCRTADDNRAYERYFSELLNYATLPFYWWNYTREKGRPADARTDDIIRWCTAHDVTMKGHPLAWNYVDPRWLPADPLAAMGLQMDRIERCVKRFAGDIDIWDVVNEAVAGDGSLTDTIWLRGIGPEYIDMAFRWAHEADPDALLFYNDWGGEGQGPKCDAIHALVRDLWQRGVPIHGVGLQMHVGLDACPEPQDVAANMERLAALGLEVQITEMDVRIEMPATQEKLDEQARVYRDMLQVCLSADNCTGFVLWGFTDSHSWIPDFFQGCGAALIFDEAYDPKPGCNALMDVLGER